MGIGVTPDLPGHIAVEAKGVSRLRLIMLGNAMHQAAWEENGFAHFRLPLKEERTFVRIVDGNSSEIWRPDAVFAEPGLRTRGSEINDTTHHRKTMLVGMVPLATLALGSPENSGLQEFALKVEVKFDLVQLGIDPISHRIKVIAEKLFGV